MLGLKRGAVALYPHEKAWETEAQATWHVCVKFSGRLR